MDTVTSQSPLESTPPSGRDGVSRSEWSELPTPLPLVGRDEELRKLRRLMSDSARRTSVVVLAGEGGVGKSRLAREFARSAEVGGWRVLSGRAYPVETGVPYALFADAFLPVMREMDPAKLTVLSRVRPASPPRLRTVSFAGSITRMTGRNASANSA